MCIICPSPLITLLRLYTYPPYLLVSLFVQHYSFFRYYYYFYYHT